MIKSIYYTFLLSLFTLLTIESSAQVKEFSTDETTFIDQLQSHLASANVSDAKKFIEKTFVPLWSSGVLTREQKTLYIENANALLKKRVKTESSFYYSVVSLVTMLDGGAEASKIDGWLKGVELLGKGRSRNKLEDYLESCYLALTKNTLIETAALAWRFSAGSYTFETDTSALISFSNVNLKCYTKGDSSVIIATTGVFDPAEGKWLGTGGNVTWERAGFDPSVTYATLENYDIRTKSSAFVVDTVTFFSQYFPTPLKGRLTEKVLAGKDTSSATYPRFESFEKTLYIKNVIDGADFKGGISVQGAKLIGYGNADQMATLIFKKSDKPFMKFKSNAFTIRPDKISASHVHVAITLGKDSIVHPSVQLKFNKEKNNLTLFRDDQGISQSPFANTYHNLDMYFEALFWDIGADKLEIGSLTPKDGVSATLESNNYFKEIRYKAIQGYDQVHPLVTLKLLAEKLESDTYTAQELASYMRAEEADAIVLMIQMANKGFVDYDLDRKEVTLKDKLYDFLLAKAGKVDYDVIQFNSDVDQRVNAVLDLTNYDLLLKGVRKVTISDSQDVNIFPKDKELVLKRNRSFQFAGTVYSGKFEFYGSDYYFDYDKFQIDLNQVDSCRLKVYAFEPNKFGKYPLVRLKSVLENIKGNILIDNPFNKSGLQNEKYPEYPIFNCTEEPFVYYDKPYVYDKVYDRERFYFQMTPFTIDSLDNFDVATMKFPGTLVSAGIFPDITNELKIQKDYSLGFEIPVPTGGYPLYGGKATFENEIKLSHDGLQGNGDITYLSSISQSEMFTFFPDSTTGIANIFNNFDNKGLDVAQSVGENVDFILTPFDDQLVLSSIKEPIKMFNDQSLLYGDLILAPSGLTGRGKMDFFDAQLQSNTFKYLTNDLYADTAYFQLNTIDNSAIALKSYDVTAHVDFGARKGDFKATNPDAYLEFPFNQYIAYMDKFNWAIDDHKIDMTSTGGVASAEDEFAKNSKFFSTHPEQDSLNYVVPKALYDIESYTINASEVPFIDVADARITPYEGKVVVMRDADMQILENATLLASRENKFHTIYEAKLDVLGKYKYTGSGKYDYVAQNGTKTPLFLGKIGVEKEITVGHGGIGKETALALNEHFNYYGNVTLQADTQYLSLDGSALINHQCERLTMSWFDFDGYIDPSNVTIPFDLPLLYEGDTLSYGLAMNTDSTSLKAQFIGKPWDARSHIAVGAEGYITFDNTSGEYRISTLERLADESLTANYLAINPKTCDINGEGLFDPGMDFGQLTTAGFASYTANYKTSEIELSASLGVDFYLHEDLIKHMTESMQGYPFLTPLNIAESNLVKEVITRIGGKRATKLEEELNEKGALDKIPSEIRSFLNFADVRLVWDEARGAYRSKGDLGLAAINNTMVDLYVPGYMEIKKKKSGDIFNLYLELDATTWYFFNYQKGVLQVISSAEDFNMLIEEMKDNDKEMKTKKNEPTFRFILTTSKKRNDFVKSMKE